jgi:hypothetical protein
VLYHWAVFPDLGGFFETESHCVAQAGLELLILYLQNAGITGIHPHAWQDSFNLPLPLCLFWVGPAFELRALHVQSSTLSVESTASPFCSGYFGDAVF